MKKLAVTTVALTVLFAGCLGGDEGDDNKIDPANEKALQELINELAITVETGADGSHTFSAKSLEGLSYTWDFGDLVTATGASVSHQYMVESGTFSVVLTVADTQGTEIYLGKTVTVGAGTNSNPLAAFTFDGPFVEVGVPFTVDASATSDPDGDALRISWYLAAPIDEPASGGHDDPGDDGGHQHMMSGTAASPDEGHDHGAGDAGDDDGAHAHAGGGLDTGNILPGESATIQFNNTGTYQMHCHPHPHMVQQVKVVPGADATAEVIFTQNAFLPSVVEIAPGGTVTYTNKEDQTALFHTSTQAAFAPSGDKLDLGDLTGDITIDAEGEYDLVLVVEDGKGQLGVAKKRVYAVMDVPNATVEETFTGGWNATVTAAPAGQTNAAQHPFEIAFPGHAIISADLEATYGDVSFRLLDSAGTELARGLNMEAMLEKGRYTIEVVPADGPMVQATYTVDLVVHLDLSSGPADDGGGGGHQH